MNTPWGEVQQSTEIIRGVTMVFTAGHGGIRVDKKFADTRFTPAAIKRAIPMGSYYYYEEDCDWAIPAWELKEHHDKFITNGDATEKIKKSLVNWNKEYLNEIGEPVE